MTLGNSSQPPLTRRQVREMAREQAPSAREDEQQLPSDEKPASTSPSKPKGGIKAADKAEKAADKAEKAAEKTAEAQSAKPRRAGTPQPTAAGDTPVITASSTEFAKPPAVAESVPVSAFAPRGSDPAPAVLPKASSKRQAPERTLTRRELRELQPETNEPGAALFAVDEAPVVDASAAGPLNPPVGHWSVDRGEQHTPTRTPGLPFDQFMTGGTGASGSPTTTNALILPSVPQQGSISGPLTATGEILITGSYDLPRSLGSSGHHPSNFDSSDMDASESDDDGGGYNPTVAPVSASRAVSTHASTRGVLTPPQKRGTTLPGVLAVTAAVLAVGVVALIVLGYVFHIF